ncbi:MAG: hypothetical protein PHO91_03615 [Patescibacteria group bacterium]|nr:hypothetical protein [Patescibacteria group bacterium]
MRYFAAVLLFLLAAYFYFYFGFYGSNWILLQPFLLALLLLYFNSNSPWFYYSFALLAGLFVDSFSGIFGLHSFTFIFIIFILKNLQLSIFTSRNILTVVVLSIFAFVIFYFCVYLIHFIFVGDFYVFSGRLFGQLAKMAGWGILIVAILHILHFNFWVKKNEEQPF